MKENKSNSPPLLNRQPSNEINGNMPSSKVVVRKLKEKCKDAARMRREKERSEFMELSKLLPLPSSTTSQLDRASIIRLTSSYLRMRAAFPEGLGENWGTRKLASLSLSSSSNCNSRVASRLSSSASSASQANDAVLSADPYLIDTIDDPSKQQTSFGKQNSRSSVYAPTKQQNQQLHQAQVKEMGSLILQTLDGFVFALHSDGKIMYISETASVLLGLPQIDLTGSSIFDYVHPADCNDLLDMLCLSETDRHMIQSQIANNTFARGGTDDLELGRSFSMRMKCILPRRNAGLIQNGYKSIHCTGYLKLKRCRYQQPLSMLNPDCKHSDKTTGQNLQRNPSSRAFPPRSKNRAHGDIPDWESYALVAVGHSLLPSASTEIKLNGNSFMFRANLDMKILFIESPALNLLGHNQNSVVGQSLYQLVHLADLKNLEEAHRMLLKKGQVISKYIRLVCQDAGSLWIQMQATLINNPRSVPKPLHIVGICFIIADNRFDESKLLLDKPADDNRNDSCMRMSATFNSLAISMGQANKRRQTAKNHPSPEGLQVIKDIASKTELSNDKRATVKRKDKSESPNKRIRQSNEDNLDTKSQVMDGDNHGTLNRVYLGCDKEKVNAGNLTHIELPHNQTIGQFRRFSDDTCSIASSITSASTTSASTTSNIGQFMMSCPPSSITSGRSLSSSSPLSLPTITAPSAILYPPIQRTSPIMAEVRESISQAELEVGLTNQHLQSHEQQQCCTQVTNTGNSGVGQIVYMDPGGYQTNNYWPVEAHNQNTIEQGGSCVQVIQNQFHQPLAGPNYYNLDEQQMDFDDYSRGYYHYNNNETTFYDGSHSANVQLLETKCGPEKFVIDQFTPQQYSYLEDNKSTRESINVTTMTPAVRPCFMANQPF